jgi:hypothetical protein
MRDFQKVFRHFRRPPAELLKAVARRIVDRRVLRRRIGGFEYMLVQYAVERMRVMASDAFDDAAEIIETRPGDRGLAELAKAIRDRKPEVDKEAIEAMSATPDVTYRMKAGHKYMLASYAEEYMKEMAGVALEGTAQFVDD